MAVFFSSASGFAKDKHPNIVVIGAGLAGLTTAYRLKEMGLDVNLYEARSRVGGRVLTVRVDGTFAELGAQNIMDGGDAANIMQLIHEMGLATERFAYPLACNFSDGEEIVSLKQLLYRSCFKNWFFLHRHPPL